MRKYIGTTSNTLRKHQTKMAIKSKTFTIVGFVLTTLCLICLIISFASDRWMQSTEDSGFQNVGLWSICFKQYKPPPWSLVDKLLDECWWVLDKEMDDFRHYLFPSWFVSTQVLVTLGLALEFIALILMVINAINCFPFSHARDWITLGICIASFMTHFIAAMLLLIGIGLFGSRANTERNWLENIDNNYLSWSFGLCVLAAFFALFAGMCLVLEFFRLRLELGRGKEPNVYLTNIPPPSSNYTYTRGNAPTSAATNKAQEAGIPEYSKRYGGSQGSIADPSVFKVSGSGEVYINRLADYDTNRQINGERGRYGNVPPRGTDQQAYSTRSYNDTLDNRRTNDYEASKQIKQPVLPEYVPNKKSLADEPATEDSDLDDISKADLSESESEEDKSKKKSKSSSDSKKKMKSRSTSDKRKSKKKSKHTHSDDDADGDTRSRRKSKKKNNGSDDERSRSRRRSKDRSTTRKSSRSRSRDLDSDSSDRGRSRSKKKRSGSRSGSKTRSASGDRLDSSRRTSTSKDKSKKKSTKHSEDYEVSGSEYSSKRKTKDRTATARSTRDFSDSESVRSKSRKKPEHSYSSYYEY